MDLQPVAPKVILRSCADYDVEMIRRIVGDGLREFGLRPSGRTLVKPNLVTANPLFQHAYTRPEFTEGVLLALRDRDAEVPGGPKMTELALGERSGLMTPTRYALDRAGYNPMLKRLGVKMYCFEEQPQVEIPLTHPGRLRDYVYTPAPVARADFFVNCPKFKAHPWTTVTFSMKNYIGIQDDRHRVIDHDQHLDEKVADLQYVIQPKFIAVDAIIAGQGRMLTPIPFPLGLIVMGNNQPALDAVCSAIVGLRAADIPHIRLASERGFGPIDLAQIEISGDVTLDQARERGRGFKVGLTRVEKYFEGTKISAYAGPPPASHRRSPSCNGHADYCWGGCPGTIQEAIEIIRVYDEQADAKMPRLHFVFGAYQGPIDARPGEKVVFVGDCVHWKGNLNGELVEIQGDYRDGAAKDPHHPVSTNIYKKMAAMTAKLLSSRNKSWLHMKGCPVSVAEQVLMLVGLSPGVKNPYTDARETFAFNKAFLEWRGATLIQRLRGIPYQKRGISA